MELKTSVFKRGERPRIRQRADGSKWTQMLKGGWFYRIRFRDLGGTARSKEHGPYRTKLEAKDAQEIEVRKLSKTHGESRKADRLTFNQFADQCETDIFAPAEFVDGSWEGGLRSSRPVKSMVKNLKSFFGARLINTLTRSDLQSYRRNRLAAGISASTANREMAIMRRMMRHALSEGLIVRDIFQNAKVIVASSEKPRDRILTPDEELRLIFYSSGQHEIPYTRKWKGREQELSVTTEVGGGFLRALIILALDSGMRRGEMLHLKWNDVDFDNSVVRLVGAYTKTLESRIAPLSARAAAELIKLNETRSEDLGSRVFPVDDFKRAWATARKLAKLNDVHFHDLRRTFITRQLADGTSPMIVAKIVGHSQLQTTMRNYTSVNLDMIQNVAERLNASQLPGEVSEMVN